MGCTQRTGAGTPGPVTASASTSSQAAPNNLVTSSWLIPRSGGTGRAGAKATSSAVARPVPRARSSRCRPDAGRAGQPLDAAWVVMSWAACGAASAANRREGTDGFLGGTYRYAQGTNVPGAPL